MRCKECESSDRKLTDYQTDRRLNYGGVNMEDIVTPNKKSSKKQLRKSTNTLPLKKSYQEYKTLDAIY